MRQESLGGSSLPNMTALSERYKSLPADELAKLRQVGKAATDAARSGSSAFGANARRQERASRKRDYTAMLEDTTSAGATTAALATVPKSLRASMFEQSAVSSSGSPLLHNVWSRLVSFKQALRAERQVAIARSKQLEEKASAYDAGQGREDSAQIAALIGGRGFDAWDAELYSRPKPAAESGAATAHTAMYWRPLGLLERVTAALRLRRKSVAGQKFFKACDAVWGSICTTFQYHRVPQVEELRRTPEDPPSLCQTAGMCLCNPRGALLQRFARKLDVAVKQHFGIKARADVRAKLGRGEAVLLFVGQTKQQWREARDLAGPGQISAFTFYQVAAHSCSLWLSTYQHCSLDAGCEQLVAPPAALEISLAMVYERQFGMINQFNLQLRWRVAVYIAQDSSRLVPVLLPNRMYLGLHQLEHVEDYQEVWCPWRKGGRGGGRPDDSGGVAAGWQDELASVVVGAAGEGEDEDDESGADTSADGMDDEGPASDAAAAGAAADEMSHDSSGDESAVASAAPSQTSSSSSSSSSSAASVLELLDELVGEGGEAGTGPAVDAAIEADAGDLGGAPAAAILRAAPAAGRPEVLVVPIEEGPTPSTLVWYKTSETFYAYCRNCGHGAKCCKNRQAEPGRSAATGRPLGFLFWWLERRHKHAAGYGMVHRDDVYPNWAERREARNRLKAIPGMDALLTKERRLRDDEQDSEPEGHF